MDGLVSRVEVLLFALLIVAGAMLAPVTKPRVDISTESVTIVDSVLRVKQECSVPINQYASALLSAPTLKTYDNALFSEDLGTSVDDRWSLLRPVRLQALLDIQFMVSLRELSQIRDLLESQGPTMASCAEPYLAKIKSGLTALLQAHSYVGFPSSADVSLFDLQTAFNTGVKAPLLDEILPVDIVVRVAFAIVSFSLLYCSVLLNAAASSKKRRSRFEFGALIFVQPHAIAAILGVLWCSVPLLAFLYSAASGAIYGAEIWVYTSILLPLTCYLVWCASRFRCRYLKGIRHNKALQPTVPASGGHSS